VLDGASGLDVHDLDGLALSDVASCSHGCPVNPSGSAIAVLDQVLEGDGEVVVLTSSDSDHACEAVGTADLLAV